MVNKILTTVNTGLLSYTKFFPDINLFAPTEVDSIIIPILQSG